MGSTSGNPKTAVMPNPAPTRAAIKASKVNVVPSATAVSTMAATKPHSRAPPKSDQPSNSPANAMTRQDNPDRMTTLCRVRASM